ncbi:MAG: 50S ribosome-binding GTPase [Thermoplasmata archaeon]|nr:50S ribosome-binding GTPase [Candidatus Sysuiplasma acidicola]MBX8637317.1 50S ribosome-binding GTPase [Candidatus Sysuiplasma acidicola]MBX8645842.1 50S ribosome-binding GTPase [Candidatus Sysuiplasma acidicola]
MRLPKVRSADDIIDELFLTASRAQGSGGDGDRRARKKEINKLHRLSEKADKLFSSYVTGFPSFEKNEFAYEIADLLVGVDELKKSLASVHGCKNTIVTVANRAAREVAKAGTTSEMRSARERAYGRVASLVHGIDDRLSFLASASELLKEVPQVSGDYTVVVAGYPNVGKSLFISSVSNARTRVEPYPFTTTELIVGHKLIAGRSVAFIDCPGLTHRALATNNIYEKKSLLAIRHLASMLLFIVDPSGTCGCEILPQLSLLDELKKALAPAKTVVAYSKADLARPEGRELCFSALTGVGMEDVIDTVRQAIPAAKFDYQFKKPD